MTSEGCDKLGRVLLFSETVPEDQGPADTWGEHITDAEYQHAHQALRDPNSDS